MGVFKFKSVSGGGNAKEISPSPSYGDERRGDERALSVIEQDWSPEEEKKAKRKLDMIIMPLLTLGFFCLRTFYRVDIAYTD